MKAKILQRLSEIESKYDVKVLLTVESGSRAWGFESKDSDYDVRFIYVHRKDWYLSLIEGRDVIEELDPDGVLDLAGWDLRKSLLLMGKGRRDRHHPRLAGHKLIHSGGTRLSGVVHELVSWRRQNDEPH